MDRLKTTKGSFVKIAFEDNSTLSLGPSSEMAIAQQAKKKPKDNFGIAHGTFYRTDDWPLQKMPQSIQEKLRYSIEPSAPSISLWKVSVFLCGDNVVYT